jgi:hypothetical protein
VDFSREAAILGGKCLILHKSLGDIPYQFQFFFLTFSGKLLATWKIARDVPISELVWSVFFEPIIGPAQSRTIS